MTALGSTWQSQLDTIVCIRANSLMKTVLTVKGMPFLSTLVLSKLSSMPYRVETLRSSSPMIGKSRAGPSGDRELISAIQPAWDDTLLAERPMSCCY
jgi:hypothetical protein